MKTAEILILTSIVVCVSITDSKAQEPPELLGSWALVVSGHTPDPRCGEIRETGVLDVERQIAARAYRGRLRSERSSEKCRGSEAIDSGVTIRVRDDVVTLVYDEDGWKEEKLLVKGGSMEGSRGDGITTRWERLESGAVGDAPTPEQLAELDTFLNDLRPELEAALNEKYLGNLEKNLAKSGLTQEESKQVAEQTVARLADCMLESMRTSVIAEEIPVGRVLGQRNLSVVFNPRSMDAKSNQCVADASANAGIRIR